ncbi:MAG: PAS domain-containing protein, partial [Desulfuromonadaceae bacterium]|nr:PAS domain-containing protein [Desulfuromonadaceae bacterium]
IFVDAGMAIVARGQAARFILANGSVIRDECGKKLGAVVVMRDITKLRRVEESLRNANEELKSAVAARTYELEKTLERLKAELEERKLTEESLRESEARLKEAQQIAHLGHWELDLQKNALYWSDEVYRIFGLEPQEFSATYEAFLEHVHPGDRDYVNRSYSESVKNRAGYEIEHRIVLKNGETRYAGERCFTEYDETGAPLRSLGTVLDITEHKRAEEVIHLQAVELEAEVAERQMAQETLQEQALLLENEIEERRNTQNELEILNENLERRVQERTSELAAKNSELERMNRIFVGRELRMMELKERIAELEKAPK